MLYRCRIPKPPLSDFVDQIWLYSGYSVPHQQERLMPTGTMELVFDLTLGDAVLAGVHSVPTMIDTSVCGHIVGVHFRPGGAFPFLGVPASELHNMTVPLSAIWGNEAELVREQILSAPDDDVRFDILEATLFRRASRLQRHVAVTHGLFRLGKPVAVADVVEETGLSQRRFIALFDAEVGVTPKVYARVQRFQRVLRRIHPMTDIDWSDVAAACGYFDQSHLIHEFRSLAGITPTEYATYRTEHLNHVPVV
jgi:AraC-like DNA-binding protein